MENLDNIKKPMNVSSIEKQAYTIQVFREA